MPANDLAPSREKLNFGQVQARTDLLHRNVLLADPRRQRPYWFDGRFLAAADLRREQDYFLLRQTDLGRAGGEGVADGLLVREGLDSSTRAEVLVLEPGFGFTDTGELVTVAQSVQVNPADVVQTQQLNAAFGLEVIPNNPGFTRTGLFILALRPVEWSANAIAAYPTSLTGSRQTEDGDIIEGCAVTLIPWPDKANDLSWDRRRARAAHAIFVAERNRGLASGTLPLAVVALQGNLIEWVDPFLVRRELGADRREGLDFGFGRRPLREAHLLQYEQQLGEILSADPAASFAAPVHFDALPPAGRLPAGAVNAKELSQGFFPRGIDVSVSFVPEDEVPVLLEESFALPPIDLTVDAKALVGTSVLILVPLPRAEFDRQRLTLAGLSWQLAYVDPELKAEATPYELLFAPTPEQRAAAAKLVAKDGSADVSAEATWQTLLGNATSAGQLWYIRRRHLPVNANAPGRAVEAGPSRGAPPTALLEAVETVPAARRALKRLDDMNVGAIRAVTRHMSRGQLLGQPGLVAAILARFANQPDLKASEVLAALAPVLDPEFGTGLKRVPRSKLTARLTQPAFAATGAIVEVDALLRAVADDQLDELHRALTQAARKPELLRQRLPVLRQQFLPPS